MKYGELKKVVPIVSPQAIVDDGSPVGAVGNTPVSVDSKGFHYLAVHTLIGATDIAVVTLKVTESDDDSVYTDVPGGDFSVTTLPSATDDDTIFTVYINKGNTSRKRFYQLDLVHGDGTLGTFSTAWATLSYGDQGPSDATGRNNAGELFAD